LKTLLVSQIAQNNLFGRGTTLRLSAQILVAAAAVFGQLS